MTAQQALLNHLESVARTEVEESAILRGARILSERGEIIWFGKPLTSQALPYPREEKQGFLGKFIKRSFY